MGTRVHANAQARPVTLRASPWGAPAHVMAHVTGVLLWSRRNCDSKLGTAAWGLFCRLARPRCRFLSTSPVLALCVVTSPTRQPEAVTRRPAVKACTPVGRVSVQQTPRYVELKRQADTPSGTCRRTVTCWAWRQ